MAFSTLAAIAEGTFAFAPRIDVSGSPPSSEPDGIQSLRPQIPVRATHGRGHQGCISIPSRSLLRESQRG